MAKPKRTTSDTKEFGADRTLAPRRIRDTDTARGRQTGIGQHAGQGRPSITKK